MIKLNVLAFTICLLLFGTDLAASRGSGLAQVISKETAVEIAKKDAVIAYKDLDPYEIEVSESKKKWFVNFVLKNKGALGGGPEYVISKKSGKILKKRYWQ